MTPILTILICILVSNYVINNVLTRKMHIKKRDSPNKYINTLHKYGEGILHWATIIVMVISITNYHHLRIFIFIVPCILFTFSTLMEWNYAKQNKTYLLSAVSCGLFIIGSIVYRLIYY
ncbi:DUF4181 domain-containing protein [Sporosarcina sp. FSL K6-1508]|uniref:DUF4181 domain-containing protein n=1 Tax=Sporosarcina sp. FSL K6-1508 TaxID=2921553 RepID=UPI0030F77C07